MLMKIKVFMFAMAALTTLPAFAQLPSYYPADYQKIVDGAKRGQSGGLFCDGY